MLSYIYCVSWSRYICSNLLKLAVESRDLSQAEKKRAKQTVHRCSQNKNCFHSKVNFFHPGKFLMSVCEIAQLVVAITVFKASDKSCDLTAK
jgi:hypothetical protein